MGRKSKYETHVKPYLNDIKIWTETLTDADIAYNLKISVRAFANYKKEYPELAQVLEDGKRKLVRDLKDSLKKKAKGFYYEEVKTIKTRDPDSGEWVERIETYRKYAQPDTGAIHLLLKNLDDNWRNDDRETMNLKKKQVELTEKKIEQSEW